MSTCPYCGRLSGAHSRDLYPRRDRPALSSRSRTCYAHRDLTALDELAELHQLVLDEDARIKRAIVEQYR